MTAHELLESLRECKDCRGRLTVPVKVRPTYETDSPDEIADAYIKVPCPACLARLDGGKK